MPDRPMALSLPQSLWAGGCHDGGVTVQRKVRLWLGERSRAATTHTNLSAVRADGRVLWVAGDETATVERLVADDEHDPADYADETSFRLADLVPLPAANGDEEADIEGLARSG